MGYREFVLTHSKIYEHAGGAFLYRLKFSNLGMLSNKIFYSGTDLMYKSTEYSPKWLCKKYTILNGTFDIIELPRSLRTRRRMQNGTYCSF